ncbi:carboxypeptidase-like regulatory domain-containing protein [Acidicapsa ligni]|uniref:carboxypeptidase-like regulatory domain-containing protein n=1 Tax=Acidicapsa ligni TaxID=542300 RepID=UPI0021DF4C63|nr:carboxypeptidase-like regulatory domain-containing protein [Acidicapsa ligni]
MNARKASWIAGGLMAAAALGLLPTGVPGTAARFSSQIGLQVANAQNFSQRIVQGKVIDDTDTLVGGATVFLKNVKTRNVRSFTSVANGSFRFAQVGMVDDYEVWAEHGKKKSAVRTISSFDSRKQVEFELKLK